MYTLVNQEKALVGAFSVIVKTGFGTNGLICGTSGEYRLPLHFLVSVPEQVGEVAQILVRALKVIVLILIQDSLLLAQHPHGEQHQQTSAKIFKLDKNIYCQLCIEVQ